MRNMNDIAETGGERSSERAGMRAHRTTEFALRTTHVLCALLFLTAFVFLFE